MNAPSTPALLATVELAPRDPILGVTEAFNDQGEEFGEHRLVDSLRRHRELAPQAMMNAVLGDVKQFSPQEQRDDITLLVARCEGR